MIKITLSDANDFLLSVTLDSESFKLRFSWNDTASFWTMGIRDEDNTSIIEGIRCVPNYPMLAQYRRPTLPKGELICIVMDDTKTDICRDDFVDSKAYLVYIPEDELDGAV